MAMLKRAGIHGSPCSPLGLADFVRETIFVLPKQSGWLAVKHATKRHHTRTCFAQACHHGLPINVVIRPYPVQCHNYQVLIFRESRANEQCRCICPRSGGKREFEWRGFALDGFGMLLDSGPCDHAAEAAETIARTDARTPSPPLRLRKRCEGANPERCRYTAGDVRPCEFFCYVRKIVEARLGGIFQEQTEVLEPMP